MVRFSVDGEATELVSSLLWDAGTTGIVEQDGVLLAGFDDRPAAESVAERAADWPATVLAIEPTEWVGTDEITMVSVGSDAPGAASPRRQLSILAGPTFGHGGHPTTVLAIELLSEVIEQRRAAGSAVSMLDVGTGSGVLAIAAATLGADPVVGIDVDPGAIATAAANAERNSVDVIMSDGTIAGTPTLVGRPAFDLIVANVLLPTQQSLASAMAGALAGDGTLVTTGYLESDGDGVAELHRSSLERAGLGPVTLAARRRRDGWLAHRFDLGSRLRLDRWADEAT